ncbi:glycosyltransferase [Faecalibacter bovis]|uniref:Glycosyltransferase n=1 Tax=Faecalibacter bovis TaxID=2898187 RepID=A0ABX7X9N7_9FLAO|nr:glycosyltransferase [Faecalibacter bovis]QTV04592.1 glycosyltransferase [Faecalibacter bovis]
MSKKSIYFLLPGLTFGGAERVISILANEIDRAKFEPTIVLFNKKGFPVDQLKSDINVIDFRIDRIRFAIFRVLKLIFNKQPDIVFGGWGEVSVLLAPFIKLFPKIKFIARETNVVSEHVTRKEILFFYRFYNNFHQIIAQSDDMKNDLIQNFRISENRIVKINNPVDFDLINQMKSQTINLGFDKSYKNIVAIGNLSPRKGFDLLLNVMNDLKEENIKLTILGDGAFKEELLQQKETLNLDNVIFKGNVPNPFVYLKEADLFILSSRYEGFPNVLLEAGACGTYSLANNCQGGINEIIQNKINGEIYSIEDTKGFAEKIKTILTENHSSEDIINSIHSRFSKEIIIKKYETIFESI